MTETNLEHIERDLIPKAQQLWNTYQKQIGIVAIGIVVVVGGWYGYNEYIVKPKEEKAADAVYKLQGFFAKDSSKLVLEGDGINKGALYIIKTFGGTKAANLCHFYAGVSYLKLGEYNKAVEHLKEFSTPAKQIQMQAYGNLGDAYSELNKNEDAIDYYKKAGTYFENDEASSSEFLFRAALLSEIINKNKQALEIYKSIKQNFPNTDKGRIVEKYINRIEAQKNDFSIK